MNKIIFVTGNPDKAREAEAILSDLNIEVENKKLEIVEIQGMAEEISKDKIKKAYELLKQPCIVDDVSLEFEALGGMPGPYIRYFVDNIEHRDLPKLLNSFENKKATAICTIGYADEKGNISVAQGITKGEIVTHCGIDKFGWDPIFKPEGEDRTYAEMTMEEKNKINHRTKALLKLKEHLTKND